MNEYQIPRMTKAAKADLLEAFETLCKLMGVESVGFDVEKIRTTHEWALWMACEAFEVRKVYRGQKREDIPMCKLLEGVK